MSELEKRLLVALNALVEEVGDCSGIEMCDAYNKAETILEEFEDAECLLRTRK